MPDNRNGLHVVGYRESLAVGYPWETTKWMLCALEQLRDSGRASASDNPELT